MDLLAARAVSRRFGAVPAVAGIDLTVPRGTVAGLIGPNGGGKSTLLRLLAGALPPDAGTIAIDGIDLLCRPTAARRRLGYLPDGDPADGDDTPAGRLAFVATAHGLGRAARAAAFDRVVEPLGLAEHWRRPVATLSRGLRRRLGLAAALLPDPPVLLLDDPTDGLDPAMAADLRALLRRIAADKAILLATRQPDEATALCDRLLVIAGGRLAAEDRPEALARRGGADGLVGALRALAAPAADTAPAAA